MMPASSILTPVTNSDEPFLVELYASTRTEEMAFAPWSGEQKQAFPQMRFEARHRYCRGRYPNITFDLIKLDDCPALAKFGGKAARYFSRSFFLFFHSMPLNCSTIR